VTARVVIDGDWFPRPIPPNVSLGERSYLHSAYAFLHYRSERPCGVRIGNDTGVYIESFFDLGADGEVVVGDHCTLVGPIFATNGRVVIGDRVLISREVLIADGAAPAPGGARRADAIAPITVGDDAWIGTRAVLLPGARLGDGVIVGAGAVVDFEVPAYAVVAGNPARVVGWARPAVHEAVA
jgi:acetyltransferase-like isoleucine patch superfamily enzyme